MLSYSPLNLENHRKGKRLDIGTVVEPGVGTAGTAAEPGTVVGAGIAVEVGTQVEAGTGVVLGRKIQRRVERQELLLQQVHLRLQDQKRGLSEL